MARPDVPFVQLLTPEGERVDNPDYPLEISPRELRDLYRDIALVRRFDNEATTLQRQGELGLWVPCLGQEAAQIGSGRAVQDRDMIFPTYREHGVAWTRGVDPLALLAMWRGATNGGWDPEAHRFGLYTIVIGDQMPHAVGYAMGMQRDGADGAVLAYFGDGASSQGDVHEAFVFASVFNAPVVFFCQNNQWAISEPSERLNRVPLARRADGYGFPGVRVDGNDVLAVLAVTRAALQSAREGQGPFLIEAYTYRMGAHTTSDDPTRYRLDAEVEAWHLKDPLERLKAHLVRTGMADHTFIEDVDREAEDLAQGWRAACRSMPDPPPTAMFDHVYSEAHPLVDRERAEMVAYLAALEEFAGEGPR